MNLTVIGVLETGEPRRPGVPENPRTTITFQQGVNLSLRVHVLRPDGSQVVLGPSDSLSWSVKKKPTDNPPLIAKTATSTNAVEGDPVFTLAPVDTKQMDAGRYVWDIWLTRVVGLTTLRDPVIPQSGLVLEATVTPVP